VLVSVRTLITSGRWAPGEIHSVSEVAGLCGVSRTPAREALLKLADAGLISFEPNVGFRVQGSSPKALAEIFHLRILLEAPAVRLTAVAPSEAVLHRLREASALMQAAAQESDEARFMRHDCEFHAAAISGSGNDRLAETVQQLRDATMALGASTVEHSRTLGDILAEHAPIQAAIEARDPVSAEAALVRHLERTGALLLERVGHAGLLADVPFIAATWGGPEVPGL
jgi:DNA-binding GntR family transcriptional regulator